jgi:hypothetical protein
MHQGSGVSAVMYRVERCTGNRVAVCTINSLDSAAPNCRTCSFGSIDPDTYLYYIEVTITRNASNLTPSVRTLRIRE